MHHWIKSYGHLSEEVDFAYWLSCMGKGLRLQAVQQACFLIGLHKMAPIPPPF